MKNILIMGANGQLGREIETRIDRYPEFRFFFTDIDTLDLLNKEQIADFVCRNDIRYMVNCAAYTAVDRAEEEREAAYRVNEEAVKNISEVISDRTKLIHLSTDYVFDGTADVPYRETDPVNPQSIYGKSKRAGEEVLLANNPDNSMIIRTAWLYSRFGNNFVKTMLRLAREKEVVRVVDDQMGSPTSGNDLAGALLEILSFCNKNDCFPGGIYHYSNEGSCSWYEFVWKIYEYAGIDTRKVEPIPASEYPTKAQRPAFSVLDKTKIKNTFGLRIPFWDESLKSMLAEGFDFNT